MTRLLAKFHAQHPRGCRCQTCCERRREKARERQRRWRERQPLAKRLWKSLRAEARRSLKHRGFASLEAIAARIAYYGGACAYCGGAVESMDHVIPVSRGGTDWPANLRPCCRRCNNSKHGLTLKEWRSPDRGKLRALRIFAAQWPHLFPELSERKSLTNR